MVTFNDGTVNSCGRQKTRNMKIRVNGKVISIQFFVRNQCVVLRSDQANRFEARNQCFVLRASCVVFGASLNAPSTKHYALSTKQCTTHKALIYALLRYLMKAPILARVLDACS